MQERSELRLFFLDGKPKGSAWQKCASPTQTKCTLLLLGRVGRVFLQACPCMICPATLSCLQTRLLLGGTVSWNLARAGADLWWDCLGEESPVALKLLHCLILSQWCLLAYLGQVSFVTGCVCTVRACLEESKRGQNQRDTSMACI